MKSEQIFVSFIGHVPVACTSRTGRTYYLHTGPRRGGGVQYYFSMQAEGSLANALPEGFEIYESVRGQVFLRRKQPQIIHDQEKASIERATKRLPATKLYKIEVRGKALTVFESGDGLDWLSDIVPLLSPPKDLAAKRAFHECLSHWGSEVINHAERPKARPSLARAGAPSGSLGVKTC